MKPGIYKAVLTFFLVVSSITSLFCQNTIFVPELKKANALFDNGDYKKALIAYREFAKTKADSLTHPEVLYRIGFCLYNEEASKASAMPYFERYNIKMSENHFEAFYFFRTFLLFPGKIRCSN